MSDAMAHPHNKARKTFVEVDGVMQPAPAPRFSRCESSIRHAPRQPVKPSVTLLKEWQVAESDIESLLRAGQLEP